MGKIGRNELCPCGSGKKYKKCCMNKEDVNFEDKIITFPHSSSVEEDPEEELMETNSGLREIINKLIDDYHVDPLDEFCGISPDKMEKILFEPFDHSELFKIKLPKSDAYYAPIMSLFAHLAEELEKNSKPKTAAGNLPLHVCNQVIKNYYQNESHEHIRSETQFRDLHIVRVIAELGEFICTDRRKFVLSDQCRGLLNHDRFNELYLIFLMIYLDAFNWEYYRGDELSGIYQQTFCFSFYLLKKFGDQWKPLKFYAEKLETALPEILDMYDTFENFALEYYHNFFSDFADFFGFIEIERPNLGKYMDYKIRTTEFFEETIWFNEKEFDL